VIPAITMSGSVPSFHRVTITPELYEAIAKGTRPAQKTTVYTCHPPLPQETGMLSKDNRKIVFQCLEAFKQFIPEDYASFSSIPPP
jgi:hypothetical protein